MMSRRKVLAGAGGVAATALATEGLFVAAKIFGAGSDPAARSGGADQPAGRPAQRTPERGASPREARRADRTHRTGAALSRPARAVPRPLRRAQPCG